MGFLEPLSRLVEQAGSPASDADTVHKAVQSAVFVSADRLDLAVQEMLSDVIGRLTPDKAGEVQDLLNEELPKRLREWQRLCGSDPFDIAGIGQGADDVGRTIRRCLERLSRIDFRSPAEVRQRDRLTQGLRCVAKEAAAQLAVAANPVALLTAELIQLGKRDRPEVILAGAAKQRAEDRERRAAAMSTADFWQYAKKKTMSAPKKRSGESTGQRERRKSIEEQIKQVTEAAVFDQGLHTALKDWQGALEKGNGEELFKLSARTRSILITYYERLDKFGAYLEHRGRMLQVHLQYLATRMATELSRSSGAEMPRLIGDLDKTVGDTTTAPPDQRLDRLSKRQNLDRFWQDAKTRVTQAMRDKGVRKRAEDAFDRGLRESLTAWEKAAYREPLDNRGLHLATVRVHGIVAEYRGRLAEIDSPELDQLDDALRLCVIRMNDHLNRMSAAGAFLTMVRT